MEKLSGPGEAWSLKMSRLLYADRYRTSGLKTAWVSNYLSQLYPIKLFLGLSNIFFSFFQSLFVFLLIVFFKTFSFHFHLSLFLSVCLSVCLFLCLFLCMPFCLSLPLCVFEKFENPEGSERSLTPSRYDEVIFFI